MFGLKKVNCAHFYKFSVGFMNYNKEQLPFFWTMHDLHLFSDKSLQIHFQFYPLTKPKMSKK